MGELESIRVFLAVAAQQSFAGAARHLGMTPASVTRTIAALEAQLGVQLLVRTTRQVSLTSAGAGYAARVTPLAEGLAEAADQTREAQGITSGRLRISAPLSLGVKVLPPVLSQFGALYPQTHLDVSLSDRFVDIVDEGYDLAIRISGPPSDKSTIWRKICKVPRLLVAASAYLTARDTPQRPEDLAGHECLGYRDDLGAEIWQLSNGKRQHSHKAIGRVSANNGDLLAKLVLQGEGIALLPRFIIEDDIASGRLVSVLPDWSTPEIWLTLYYPPYEQLPLRVATFSDFFETHVNETCPL
ncbi:DNA-binding transcriptional regulator, LysR family [Pseudorhodobacter antarcticus]|uniref:DNA-binding transcriptional regulator, LysR family n=1 Tax=Pseudorhodobacter antarcticus TaxID=1077947 RepID=A0A1H8L3R5_9RHOB|nr:LysR family transcriptional regulator [Pseudorhodobacter antarcticus]SEN99794.1 DNA-binding transcriptional regulator, LysR family [Pseudorhodobacter antarcticus]